MSDGPSTFAVVAFTAFFIGAFKGVFIDFIAVAFFVGAFITFIAFIGAFIPFIAFIAFMAGMLSVSLAGQYSRNAVCLSQNSYGPVAHFSLIG